MTFNNAEIKVIEDEMRRDPNIVYLTGISLGPESTVKEFGWNRVQYGGILETQTAGAGIGIALAGGRSIIDLGQITFAQDAWGQIVLQAAKMRFKVGYKRDCPAIFKMTFAGATSLTVHHSGTMHNWLANAPGLMVAVPSTPVDVVGLYRTALRTAKDPVVMMAGGVGNNKGIVPDNDYTIPFGKADIKRPGKDVTIVAISYWVQVALDAAEDLSKQGIQAEVWDPRMLIPLDRESLIASVKRTGGMVVVDQAPKSFGTTGEFMATVAETLTPIPPMARVATKDVPIGANPTAADYLYPTKAKIIKAVKDVIERKRQVIGSK